MLPIHINGHQIEMALHLAWLGAPAAAIKAVPTIYVVVLEVVPFTFLP